MINMLSLKKSLRIFGTLQIDVSHQVKDTVVAPVESHIGGRGLCTDTCSLNVAGSHICNALIAHTEPSGTGTFRNI
jgi:hypothetical protein